MEHNLPKVTVRILEVPRIAAIERWLCRLDDLCTRPLCLSHHGVDLFPGGHVVADRELDRAGCFHRQTGVRREALARPQGHLEARMQLEESDSAILELGADDAL